MDMLSSITALFRGSSSLVKLTCLDFGIQWGLWAVSAALHTEKFYDLAGKRYSSAALFQQADGIRLRISKYCHI